MNKYSATNTSVHLLLSAITSTPCLLQAFARQRNRNIAHAQHRRCAAILRPEPSTTFSLKITVRMY
jgi:hypothetical protein